MKRTHRLTWLYLTCQSLIIQNAVAATSLPEPLAGAKKALTVKFEIKNPVTETDEQFINVRQMLKKIDDETDGVAEDHPMAGIACGECHITDDISIDHYDTITREDEPTRSCGKSSCHDLVTAAKMPFWAIPYVAIDDPKKLSKAIKLLDYAKKFSGELPKRMAGLPAFSDTRIGIEILDEGLYRLKRDAVPFFLAQTDDLLPEKTLKQLANPIFEWSKISTSTPTLIEANMDARVKKARALHPSLIKFLPTEMLDFLSGSSIELRYKPSVLPIAAMDLFADEMTKRFPSSTLKAAEPPKDPEAKVDETLTIKEWEIPATAEYNKTATIRFQIRVGRNDSEVKDSSIQIRNLAVSQFDSAIDMLATLQESYPEISNEYARCALTFQAFSSSDKAKLLQNIQNTSQFPASGDLRWAIKHKIDAKGSIPTKQELAQSVLDKTLAQPTAVRKLKSDVRFANDLTLKEINTEVTQAALSQVTVSTKQVSIKESGKTKLIFTITRQAETPLSKPLIVYYSLSGTANGGKDYVKPPKMQVTLPKGKTNIDVALSILNDKVIESTETVILTLLNPKNEYSLMPESQASIMITDDD